MQLATNQTYLGTSKKDTSATRVLEWCAITLSDTIPTHVTAKELRKVFPNTAHGKYLEANLLIRTGFYQVGKHGFSYLLNKVGFDKLAEAVRFKTTPLTKVQQAELKHAEELTTGNFSYSDKANRLWHPLQNLSTKTGDKEQLFSKWLPYNYDISAAAPTILLQLAQKAGMPAVLCEPIQSYLDNKAALREELAEALHIEVKIAKRVVNSLFNGAKLQRSGFCTIFRLLDRSTPRMETLMSIGWVKSLRASVKAAWKWLERKMRRAFKTGKQKWELYFTCERLVLNSVVAYLKSAGNKFFTEHDGFRAFKPVDVAQLREHVAKATGFVLSFDAQGETQGDIQHTAYGVTFPPVVAQNQQRAVPSEPEAAPVLFSSVPSRVLTNLRI